MRGEKEPMIPLTETTDASSALGFLYPHEKLKWGGASLGATTRLAIEGSTRKQGYGGAGGRAHRWGDAAGRAQLRGAQAGGLGCGPPLLHSGTC